MDPQRWQRIAELYESAYAHKPEERQGFLRDACAGDNGLLREVQELLQQDVSKAGVLEKIAAVLERGPGKRTAYRRRRTLLLHDGTREGRQLRGVREGGPRAPSSIDRLTSALRQLVD